MSNESIIDIIKKRKSTRTFAKEEIKESNEEEIKKLISFHENCYGPFGFLSRFSTVKMIKNKSEKGNQIGTYGMIKNPQAYIVGSCLNHNNALVDYGYCLESLVLELTRIGISTCWLGGTFNRDDFSEEVMSARNEIIPSILPIGYENSKPRMKDAIVRYIAKSNHRKPWKELFYIKNFNTPLNNDSEELGLLKTVLEMVRLGPSASNKQPWRIIVSEDNSICDIYLNYDKKYQGNKLGFEMQYIDIGIAMSHFELSCEEIGLNGFWKEQKERDISNDEDTIYISSWITK